MTSQELKNSILQFAVQGKLVPQDPHDEPASELLKKIKAEKERLIKDKVIKKDKPLLPLKEEDKPFEIPESWEWVRFSDYLDVRDGTHDTPKYTTEGFPLVTSKNLDNGSLNFDNAKLISALDHYNINQRSKVDDGDILFAMIGSIGNPVLVIKDREFSIKNMALFKPYSNTTTYMKYVYTYLLKEQETIKKVATGGVQSFVSLSFIRNYLIPIPPLAEQQRIVAKIEELLPLVEQYGTVESELRKLNTKFPEQLKKSVLQYAVQGKLVPQNPKDEPASLLLESIKAEKKKIIKEKKIKQDKPLPEIKEDEIPFEIPTSWEWVRLGDIVSILGDGIHGTPNYDLNGEYYFINGNNLNNGKIIFKASTKRINYEEYLKHRKELNLRTILVSINGTLGNIAFYNNEKIILGKSACYFNLFEPLNMNYIKLLINSSYFEKYAISSATQTTIQNVSLKSMRELLIPLPPLSEQKLIVEKVEEVLSYCDRLIRQGAKLE